MSTSRGVARSIRSGCSTRSAAHPRRAAARGRARGDVDRSRERDRAARRARKRPTRCCCVDTVTSLGGIPVEVDAWGDRRRVLGYAEVPRRAARSRAGQLLGAGGRAGTQPVGARRSRGTSTSALLADYVGTRAPVPPHRTDLDALRVARRASVSLLEEGLEASWARHRQRRRAPAGRRCPTSGSGRSRRSDGCRSSRRSGCPKASTTPRCAASCAPASTSRSAAASATLAGKGWRIGLMGHWRASSR